MPRKSQTDNVRKICDCTQWRLCAHPWYLDFQAPIIRATASNLRSRFAAVPAGTTPPQKTKHAARSPQGSKAATRLLSRPTIRPSRKMLEAYGRRPASTSRKFGSIVATKVDGQPFGEGRMARHARYARAFRRHGRASPANRDLAFLRAMFNWAVLTGCSPRSPFRIGHVAAVKLAREEARTRRLQGEEAGCSRRRRARRSSSRRWRPAAAGASCCRCSGIRCDSRRGSVPAGAEDEGEEGSRVPISTVLQDVLDARQHDPAGEPLPPEAYVFGDASAGAGTRSRPPGG